jgi:hypothetical protein
VSRRAVALALLVALAASACKRSAPEGGLAFLAPYAEFRDLTLSITESQLREHIAKHRLEFNRDERRGMISYHLQRADGENVMVMFNGGRCAGIQRLHPMPRVP